MSGVAEGLGREGAEVGGGAEAGGRGGGRGGRWWVRLEVEGRLRCCGDLGYLRDWCLGSSDCIFENKN